MKKVIVFMLLFSSWVFSAYGADFKVGFVDSNRILTESEEGKKASKTLQEMISTREALLDEKKAELKKLGEELDNQKKSKMFNDEALKEKEANLNKLMRSLQLKANEYQEEVQKKETELKVEIIKGANDVIKSYGEKEGFSLILESVVVIYAQKKNDVTDEILKKYNEASKTKK
jgi:outer membrane protein